MARNWTQEMCADRAGMSVRTIQKIEAYEMEHPPVDTVSKLLVAFHCTWDELLGTPQATISAASMPVIPKKKN
jgi:transcriptional regulator with XRE-family HTH domain